MTTQTYSIRPGRRSDVLYARDLYLPAFDGDMLLDILFPTRHDHAASFSAHLLRLFVERWWTPNYDLTVCVDENDRPVGFTWWKRPNSQLSFYERWLSPYAWAAPIVRSFLSLKNWLFPVPNLDAHAADTFTRVFSEIQPGIMNSDHRREAWYLSTLCVDPKLQGHGLGSKLLKHGLGAVDRKGVASWLIGLKGLDAFYGRYGFKEVARANVGELSTWDGGLIMFRE